VIGPDEVLGEIALLDGLPRSADATALVDCVVLKVERAPFVSMLQGSADLCLRLMTVLCDKVRKTTVSVEEALLLDVPHRLARQLRRLADEHGLPVPEGTKIGVKMSQGELATLIGASREKVNRQLRLWEGEGFILTQGGYWILRRPDQLGGEAQSPEC